MKTHSRFLDLIHSEKKPILLFDGAMGTSFQSLGLTSDDFGGLELEGCNENLVNTRPDLVREVHKQFLDAGCDVIETNTFGASSVVLLEYGLERKSYEINKLAAEIASEVANEFSTDDQPRFVAGSIGPTTKLPTLGHIDFDTLRQSYCEQACGLITGGIDLFIVETCQDVLQIKSAILGIKDASTQLDVRTPIMVSVTMETTGSMLIGSDISAVVSILEPFDIDILGLNCATGPQQMKEHIKYLSKHSPFVLSCIPNAGLPENIGGQAHYRLTPIELKMQLMSFIEDLGVQVIGGCCGTTPSHIAALSEISKTLVPAERYIRKSNNVNERIKTNNEPSASSIYSSTTYKQDNSFLIVGERLNASGSKRTRELLNKEDWDGLIAIARSQLKENAHVLDINVDYVGRDGEKDMNQLVSRVVSNVNLPLMLDSTEWQKMESGLKVSGGKSILNSTNYEDGEERFFKVLKLAREYGAGIVVGTIDEDGMARTAQKKFQIAERAYKDAIEYGIPPHEIFYDPLALPISTGIEEDRKNGVETIKSIELIRNRLEGVHIILGVSNISFGLSGAARIALNSIFLHHCCRAGMDSAIVSPAKILPLNKINPNQMKICNDLIYDNRTFENNICNYDPLTELTRIFEGVSTKSARNSVSDLLKLPIEKRLSRHIVEGEREGLDQCLKTALDSYPALTIINQYLLEGMKTVGELFASGEMQLPFVLQSAQTMKSAVAYLEPYMDKTDGINSSKAKFLIATVKGDVHDIGKNLVDIILSNNGYEVINLGIKQDVSAIIEAQNKFNADCIAMSGLLVKSTAFMKDNLQAFNDASITVPVILGGAALTPRFVYNDCGQVYKGRVIYGKDAFTDLRFMEAYITAKTNKLWDNIEGFTDGTPDGIVLSKATTLDPNSHSNELKSSYTSEPISISSTIINNSFNRSNVVSQEPHINPEFLGTRILQPDDIDLEKVISFLDKNALYSGQWQLKRSPSQTKEEYQSYLHQSADPILQTWLDRITNDSLILPAVAYGYFPCGRVGNELIIFSPSSKDLVGKFIFPRQKSGNRYCISDFYADLVDGKPTDFIPMQAVTVGKQATSFAQNLYEKNEYQDYLFFHGLAVQLAEALAEYSHSIIRGECGFQDPDEFTIRDILAQRYRGCRYSFGYPACPNVGDSRLQLDLLEAHQIQLSMDETDQLHPEQSTTALVALHSMARYFSA